MNVQVRIPGTEHWTSKGDVKLFLWNKVAGDPAKTQGHDPVRARLLDGLAADLRSRRAGAAGLLRNGVLRQAGLRLLVRRHGGLRPLHQGPRQQRSDLVRRRRLLRRGAVHPEAARAAAPSRLRHLVGRAARRAVRRAASRDGRPPRARRACVDRRRLADIARAAQEAARIPVEEPPPDQPRLRVLDLQPRPSRRRRRCHHQRLRRRDPQARRSACRPAPMWTCARSCRS